MKWYDLRSGVRGGLCRVALRGEAAVNRISGGRAADRSFYRKNQVPYVGSDVQITGESDCETFLEKKGGGEFRILSTTDLHLMSDTEKDRKTIDMLLRNLAETRPDLVVLTGDVFTTDHPIVDAVRFAEMMEKTGVYWFFVYGNHECREDFSIFKYSLMRCAARYPHCLCKCGPDSLFGVGNFAVNIMENGKLVLSLFAFDSGRNILEQYRRHEGCPEQLKGYDFIKKNQIDWYRSLCGHYRRVYGNCRNFVYLHIPLCEYEKAVCRQGEEYGLSGECPVLYGEAHESVGCSPFNSGLFDAMLDCSGAAVFAGHDHINDFCAEYQGIYLVYSQPAGYDEYHMGTKFGVPESQWLQGVTLTDVKPDGSFSISRRKNAAYLTDQ